MNAAIGEACMRARSETENFDDFSVSRRSIQSDEEKYGVEATQGFSEK